MLPVSQKHCFRTLADRWGDTETFGEFLNVFKKEILTGMIGAMFVFAIQFFIVMFLFAQLATYLSDPTVASWWGWLLICVMLVANLIQNFSFAIVWVQNVQFGVMAKMGFSTCVAKKAMRLRIGDESLVVNMMSNDAGCCSCFFFFFFFFFLVFLERIFEMGSFFIWTISAPLQVVKFF
jgi:hypothetical protein